ALALAGCSTGSTVDALRSVAPSNETTSSIVRPVVPQAAVGEAVRGYPEGSAPAAISALAEPERLDTPAAAQVAMMVPQRPAASAPKPKVISQQFRDAKPVSFGKVTPQHHLVHGVDVSRWQGDI